MKLFNIIATSVLGAAMAIGVGATLANRQVTKVAHAAAGDSPVVLDASSLGLTSTATSEEVDKAYGGVTYTVSSGAKATAIPGGTTNNFTSNSAILIGKSGTYIYNKTAMQGVITKFEVFSNKNSSVKVSIGVKFATSAITTWNATGAYTATLETADSVYDASSAIVSGAKFFRYQVTNANNSQVQLRITYSAPTLTASDVIALINAIGEVEYSDACLAKITEARNGYNSLSDSEKANVTNYSTLTAAEAEYQGLKNTHLAAAVDELIDAIGTVVYTDECNAKIVAARNAYDALTDDQKALVTKLSVLEAAEAAYDALSPATLDLTTGKGGTTEANGSTPTTWTNGVKTDYTYVRDVKFTALGSGNDGKYYTTDTSWRFYNAGEGGVRINVPASNKITRIILTWKTGAPVTPTGFTADKATSPTTYTPNTGVVVNEITFLRDTANFLLQKAVVEFEINNDPAVSINELANDVVVGDTGTFGYNAANVEHNISVSWSSSEPTILSVNSSTGSYEALKAGKVTITANLTSDEGNAVATMDVIVNCGLITINEAKAICAELTDNATTVYTVIVCGYIVNFDADGRGAGNERALNIADAKIDGSLLMAFGVYNSDPLRQYAVLNGQVTYKGQLQNYNGSYQIKNLTLIDYTDDAMTYAKASYQSLDAACVEGTQAVTNEQWQTLKTNWGYVDGNSKTKLQAATSSYAHDEFIGKWIARYTLIVNSGKEDFMGLGVGSPMRQINKIVDNSTALIIATVSSFIALTSACAFFIIRKKRFSK